MKPIKSIVLCLMASLLIFTIGAQAGQDTSGNRDGRSKKIAEDIRRHFSVNRYAEKSLALPADLPKSFSVVVERNGVPKELYLWKHSVRSKDYKVVAAKNGKYHHFNPGPVRTYIGVVKDEPDHLVSAFLNDKGLSAAIYRGKSHQWQIEPLGKVRDNAARNEHVVYDAEDEEPLSGACGVDPSIEAEFHSEPHKPPALALSASSSDAEVPVMLTEEFISALSEPESLIACELHQADIVIVADYTVFVNNYGCNITATQNRIEQHVNNLTIIYGRDALITYQLTGTIIRSDPVAMGFNDQYYWENAAQADPSTCTFVNDSGTADLGFGDNWSAQAVVAGITSWDFVHLMTADNNGGVLGVAWVPGSFGWSVDNHEVMAHEIGHNWGLGHCNDNGDCHIMCSGYGGCDGNPSFFGQPGASYLRDRGFSVNWVVDVGAMADQVPPKAFNDYVTIDKDGLETQGNLTIDVLSNDHDANCDTLSIAGLISPTPLGSTIIESGGQILYTPPTYSVAGTDTFTYDLQDGNGNQNTATVTVNITIPELVGYWKLDETTGTTGYDSARHEYHGTVQGNNSFDSGSVGGQFGNALTFDGTDDYVEIPALNLYSNTITISGWIKRNGSQYEYTGVVFSRSGSTVAGIGVRNNGELYYHWNDLPSSYNWSSGLIAPDGQWIFFALVVEPTIATIYTYDGTLRSSSQNIMHDIEEFNGTTRIGQDAVLTRYFKGAIDDVRIYNQALTQADIDILISGGTAESPQPFDGAEGVRLVTELQWAMGATAVNNDVYFGTDYNDILNADTQSLYYEGRQSSNAFDPGTLESFTNYFWRIDQVDVSGTITPGSIWRFTTGNGRGGITRQVWNNIGGNYITDLTNNANYPDNPDLTEIITSFEGPVNWAENYGSRIYGFLIPPTTGNYTFWIASDDYSELWLSSNENSDNAIKIAYAYGATSSREWTKYPSQQSSPVSLSANRPYYIMALHKEGVVDDNIAVAWQGPGINQQVIPGNYLMPYAVDYNRDPVFSSDPLNGIDAWEGYAYSYSVAGSATAFDGGTILYTKVAGPLWLQVAADGELSGVPGDGHTGNNTFEIRATDNNRATAKTTLLITVQNTFTGEMGLNDFVELATRWMMSGCQDIPTCEGADLTDDGNVGITDLETMASMWLIEKPYGFLVAQWPFDIDASDVIGDNNGVLVNGGAISQAEGEFVLGSGALLLDGIDDYVEIPDYKGITGSGSRTCAMWIKTSVANKELLSWGSDNYGGKWFILLNITGNLQLSVGGGNIYGVTNVADGQWHHIAVVFEDDGSPNVSEVALYIDGIPETIGSSFPYTVNTGASQNVQIGFCEMQGWYHYFDGLIDDVRIYERALTEAEIAVIAQQ